MPLPLSPGGTGYLRPGDVLAPFLERGHAGVRAAQLPGDRESPQGCQRREVRLNVDGHAQVRIHAQRLVRGPLPLRQQPFPGQAGQYLLDLPLADRARLPA